MTPREKKLLEYLQAFAARTGDVQAEEAICELEMILSEKTADIENALCELDK